MIFPDLDISSPNRIAIIPKTFFLAKTFYRYSMRIFRDHGTLLYLSGVNTQRGIKTDSVSPRAALSRRLDATYWLR